MKNFLQLFLLFTLIFSATHLTAQIKAGVKVGVVDATQNISLDGTLGLLGGDSDSRIGYNFGVFAEIGENNLRFQPELLLSSKGSFRPNDSLGLADRDHVINYLEIPLQAKLYILTNEKLSIYGIGGIYIGLALNGKVVEEGISTDYSFTFDDNDLLGYSSKIDYGLPFGAGINVPIGPGHLVGEIRYHYGMKKVQESRALDTGGGTGIGFNSKNRSTALNIGYMIGF